MKIIIFILSLLIPFFISQPIEAGSFQNGRITYYMEWSAQCHKPIAPNFHAYNDYNSATKAIMRYARELDRYVNCVQKGAQEDINLTRRAILQGLENQKAIVMNDLRKAERDLNSRKRSFK